MIRKPTQSAIQFALTAIVAAASLAALPAHAISDTATASGTVVAPITITAAANLEFGTFAAGTGGTVTVSTSGARTVGGAVLGIGGTPGAARFDIVGIPNSTYSIVLTGSPNLTNTTGSGGETMALSKTSSLTANNTTSGNVTSGMLSAGGLQSLFVGGTLSVASGQVYGVYTGTVIATVEYN